MKKTIIVKVFSILILFLPITAIAQVIFAIDDQLDEFWVVEKKVAPEYPSRALERNIGGCVAVGFVIQPDGSTGDHEVLAHYPSKIFDKSAIRAAKKFTYKPSDQNPDKVSVYTLNSFTYEVTSGRKFNPETQKQLSKACTDAAKKVLESDVVDSGG
jgi:TonB family protein